MIADLIPLLAFAAFVVIARNVFEAYVLEHARKRIEAQELVRVRASHSHYRERGVAGRGHSSH
jgi:hypothetical protein